VFLVATCSRDECLFGFGVDDFCRCFGARLAGFSLITLNHL